MSPFGTDERLSILNRGWRWFLVTGILTTLLGACSIAWPVASSLSITTVLAVLLIVGGVSVVVQSVQFRNGTGWRLFQAFVAFASGVLMLRAPVVGMSAVAMVLAFYFIMSGTAKLIISIGLRGFRGWAWCLISAIASIGLGVYTFLTFPISALWIPGIILGVDFVIFGISSIAFSLALRKSSQQALEEPGQSKAA